MGMAIDFLHACGCFYWPVKIGGYSTLIRAAFNQKKRNKKGFSGDFLHKKASIQPPSCDPSN